MWDIRPLLPCEKNIQCIYIYTYIYIYIIVLYCIVLYKYIYICIHVYANIHIHYFPGQGPFHFAYVSVKLKELKEIPKNNIKTSWPTSHGINTRQPHLTWPILDVLASCFFSWTGKYIIYSMCMYIYIYIFTLLINII